MRLNRETSQLLIVDVQERLLPAMTAPDQVLDRVRLLAEAARRLDVPVTISEQYPKGLGATVAGVHEAAGNGARTLEKQHFSCWGDAALRVVFEAERVAGRPQIIVCGIEAHVCVAQTVLDLQAQGFATYVVGDAIASRQSASKDIAIVRMARAGAEPVTTEMVVFEWLERAGTPEFKALQPLIK